MTRTISLPAATRVREQVNRYSPRFAGWKVVADRHGRVYGQLFHDHEPYVMPGEAVISIGPRPLTVDDVVEAFGGW